MNAQQRVLIADDESSMRLTLSDILTDNGFYVATASSGESAIEKCSAEHFDVVLMDMRMPGAGGLEAFRELRKRHPKLRVVLMSAYGEEELKHEVLAAGAVAFLDKPLNLNQVIRLLANEFELATIAITGDEQLSESLQDFLQPGCKPIRVVAKADDAVELVRQLDFDVAFIDVDQLESDGLDCYLALRGASANITAVMLSSSDTQAMDVAQEAVRRTAYTILKKPLQASSLKDLMAQLHAQRISGSVRKPS